MDVVTVVEVDGVALGNIAAVDHDAVFHAQVDDQPTAVEGRDQLCVPAVDPGIQRGSDQVDVRVDVLGNTAAAD